MRCIVKQPAVYIITNKRGGALNTGVTSALMQRVYQHSHGLLRGSLPLIDAADRYGSTSRHDGNSHIPGKANQSRFAPQEDSANRSYESDLAGSVRRPLLNCQARPLSVIARGEADEAIHPQAASQLVDCLTPRCGVRNDEERCDPLSGRKLFAVKRCGVRAIS
jgi:hypothetical protein